MLVIWIFGKPATPALIPFGVMLEVVDPPLILLVPLTGFAIATDGVDVGAFDGLGRDDAASGALWWFQWWE